MATWVMAIARRKLWNHYRQQRRHPLVSLENPAARDLSAPAEPDPYRLDLELALDRFAPAERELYRRFYRERSSVAEISHALGLPEGTVKYRLFQLRRKLTALLG